MGVTFIGAVVIGIGAMALLFSVLPLRASRMPAAFLFGATIPMSASAAAVLPFGSGASVLLSAVAAGFFCLTCLPQVLRTMGNGPSPAMLWLICFVVVAMLGAFLLPATFGGATMVFALDRTAEGVTDDALKLPLVPLRASTSAITQSLWLCSTVVVFFAVAATAKREPAVVASMIWAATLSQVMMALLDGSRWHGMALFRTAAYEIAPGQALSGFTRLTGAATEPSQFGAVSASLAAWHLWRMRSGSVHGLAAAALTACAAASLSTTAIATLAMVLIAALLATIGTARSFGALAIASLVGLAAVAVGSFLLLGPFAGLLNGLLDTLFISKITSESGVERGIWAAQAMTNLAETYGLGTGLGSAKASGWATALLGQTGIVGAALMLAFLWTVLWAGTNETAARAMLLAVICAALLSEGRADPGYLFAIAAGVIVAARRGQPKFVMQREPIHASPAV